MVPMMMGEILVMMSFRKDNDNTNKFDSKRSIQSKVKSICYHSGIKKAAKG